MAADSEQLREALPKLSSRIVDISALRTAESVWTDENRAERSPHTGPAALRVGEVAVAANAMGRYSVSVTDLAALTHALPSEPVKRT